MSQESEAGSEDHKVVTGYGESGALEQQDWPFHESEPFTEDIDFEVGQLRVLHLGLG